MSYEATQGAGEANGQVVHKLLYYDLTPYSKIVRRRNL